MGRTGAGSRAIRWASEGWTVRPHVEFFWSQPAIMGRVANYERLSYTPAAKALYCREDGTPKKVGDRVVNPDLATARRAAKTHDRDARCEMGGD